MELTVLRARHNCPERDGFTLERAIGIPEHVFLHFSNPIELLIQNQIVLTPPDACVFFQSGTPQWLRSQGPLTHDWLHCTGSLLPLLDDHGLKADTLYLCSQGKAVTQLIQAMEWELLQQQPYHREMATLQFRELLITLTRSCRELNAGPIAEAGSSTAEVTFHAIRNQMLSHLSHPWQLADLATMACLSPSRFSAVYKAQFGIPPIEDLIQARMETARKRLTDTNISIRDLAENLGYRNVTHFCRQFKKLTNQTPKQYRSQHTKPPF